MLCSKDDAAAVPRFTASAAARRCTHGLALCAAPALLAACSGQPQLSFLNAQGPVAATEAAHFWLVTTLLFVLVALPVFIGTVWILWRYRYGNTRANYAPRWKSFRPLEFFTWGGPVVIVLFLSVLVWRNTQRLDPYRAIASDAPALHVQVVGYDWKWLFIYPELGIASVGQLAFPAGRPLSMDLTTTTVMQSFFIPALGSQIYAMGGMVTQLNLQADEPGRFLGENTMYNGNGFHAQKFTAAAMTPGDFNDWVQRVRDQGAPLDAPALNALSTRANKDALRAALPRAAAPDGSVYFSDVQPDFFKRLVMSVMAAQPLPAAALTASAQPGAHR